MMLARCLRRSKACRLPLALQIHRARLSAGAPARPYPLQMHRNKKKCCRLRRRRNRSFEIANDKLWRDASHVLVLLEIKDHLEILTAAAIRTKQFANSLAETETDGFERGASASKGNQVRCFRRAVCIYWG